MALLSQHEGNYIKMHPTDEGPTSASDYLSSYLPFPNWDSDKIGTESQIRDAPHVINILVAHESGIFRDSVVTLLRATPGLRVVGEISDDQHLLEAVRQLGPDVVLLDLAIRQEGGFEVLKQLRSSEIHPEVIVLCRSEDATERLHALRHGARGVILKTDKVKALIEGIRKVAGGEYWIGSDGVKSLVHSIFEQENESHAGKNRYGLTKRECDVILSVLEGLTNPEIAERFSLSEQTVKHHLSHIFDKLGVYSRLELALFAVNHHLFENSR
ncbi:MAG: LuxR C-terminal-related transcriptional regulator [Acidobacteriota bacterium]